LGLQKPIKERAMTAPTDPVVTVDATAEECQRIADASELRSASESAPSAAEAWSFEETLARRNPELLEKLNAEFEAMTDAELAVVAGLAPPDFDRREPFGRVSEGFDESSFADRYGADVPARRGAPSDALWLKWWGLDRLIGEADERAHREAAGGAFDLYKDRAEELLAPIFDRLDEVEERIANMIPTTIRDCLIQLRLLKVRWACEPSELDDRLLANLLAGVEVMATAGG
jgi:hypothetical protein